MTSRVTPERDLRGHVDRFGNISVAVEIGGGPGARPDKRPTGANATPATVARFLRDLADDVERAGEPCPSPSPT
jgi:hypothetical protein